MAKNSVKLFRNGFLVSSGSFGGTMIPVLQMFTMEHVAKVPTNSKGN